MALCWVVLVICFRVMAEEWQQRQVLMRPRKSVGPGENPERKLQLVYL